MKILNLELPCLVFPFHFAEKPDQNFCRLDNEPCCDSNGPDTPRRPALQDHWHSWPGSSCSSFLFFFFFFFFFIHHQNLVQLHYCDSNQLQEITDATVFLFHLPAGRMQSCHIQVRAVTPAEWNTFGYIYRSAFLIKTQSWLSASTNKTHILTGSHCWYCIKYIPDMGNTIITVIHTLFDLVKQFHCKETIEWAIHQLLWKTSVAALWWPSA